jgi:hypothetical protein
MTPISWEAGGGVKEKFHYFVQNITKRVQTKGDIQLLLRIANTFVIIIDPHDLLYVQLSSNINMIFPVPNIHAAWLALLQHNSTLRMYVFFLGFTQRFPQPLGEYAVSVP